MLRLTTKLTVKSKIVLKCEKHRNYNPEKDGRDGVRGACSRCLFILSVYNSRQALVNAARDYEQISKEFETIKPRAPRKPGEREQALPGALLGADATGELGSMTEISEAIKARAPKPNTELGRAMARNSEQYHLLNE